MAVIGSSFTMADEPRRAPSPDRNAARALASTQPGHSTQLISIESVVIDERRRIVYTGLSMNPTLREPDLLQVEPYGNGPVRAGDVVCFKSPEKDINIVHRVMSVGRRSPVAGHPIDGIRTRGDNNPRPDPWVLGVGSLLGRVVAAQRGSRRRPIPGGQTGRMIALSVRLRKAIRNAGGQIPHHFCEALVRSGPFDFLLPRAMRPRLVSFRGREVTIHRLLMGRFVIGRYDRERKEWQIRRPFRLFLDEQTLTKAVSLASRKELRD
jgi:signal peptidase I